VPGRAPADLVGRVDRRLAVCPEQPVRNAGKHVGHAVADLYHTPWAQARLVAPCASGEAMEIGPGGGRGQPWGPGETLGQERGGPRLAGPTAARARPLR
jgi:hypothetical protein